MRKTLILLSLALAAGTARSQVIISLLLGDKLNTGKIEFGLDGGINFSNLKGLEGAETRRAFNLGFYFDIKLKKQWQLHTGVIVKSPLGASGIEPYSLNDPALDQSFEGGSVKRKISYFLVPVFARYRFANRFFVEGGIEAGLRSGGTDEFQKETESGGDLTYEVNIRPQFHPLDFGLGGGIGYRFSKGNGINVRLSYYHGLVDVVVNDDGPGQFNRSYYATVGIPIGATKAKEKQNKKQ